GPQPGKINPLLPIGPQRRPRGRDSYGLRGSIVILDHGYLLGTHYHGTTSRFLYLSPLGGLLTRVRSAPAGVFGLPGNLKPQLLHGRVLANISWKGGRARRGSGAIEYGPSRVHYVLCRQAVLGEQVPRIAGALGEGVLQADSAQRVA